MNNESNKIASNTLSQIIGRLFVLVISLASIKLITNYLGPEGTGYYNTVIIYFSFFIVIADMGFFSVAVREIAKSPEKTREILSNVFSLRLISAVVTTLVSIIIVFLTNYPPEIKYGVLIASLFPIFNLAGSVYDMLFQARLIMQKAVWSELISKVVAILGIYLSVIYNLGFYYIVFTISLAAVVNFILKALFASREAKIGLSCNRFMMKDIIQMSLPLGVVFVVNNIYFRIDALMLFYFKGATEVGIYTVAYKVLEVTLFAGSYLSASIKPLLSRSINDDRELTQKTISKALLFLLFMALAVSIISISFSKEIILFLSNQEFISGAGALIVLGFSAVFIYLSGLFGEIMIAKDLRKTLLIIAISVLIINVLLNIYLIPRYSLMGAAYSTLTTEIILLSCGYFVSRKIINIIIDYNKVMKLILAAFLSVGLSFLIKTTGLYFLINLVATILFYFTFSYRINALPQENINHYLKSLSAKWTKK